MTDKTVITGLDTGFFVLHGQQDTNARTVWAEIGSGERQAVVSALTLYELHRLGLKGAINPAYAKQCLESIPLACELSGSTDCNISLRAAQTAHGLGLSMADSIILSAFLARECREIYTTDKDLESYRDPLVRVINMRR